MIQNGNYNVGGSCAQGQSIPAVAVYQAQPDTCPNPGATRLATQTQGTVFENPSRTCRLELGDLSGNTAVASFLVIGAPDCSDIEIREQFELDDTIILIRENGPCELLGHQTVTGKLEFTIDGEEAAANSQFAVNAQQSLMYVTSVTDCAFRLTRDYRCAPCENGELIQSFGSVNCSPIIVGPQAAFGYRLVAGVTLLDVVICICTYSVENFVSCVAPPVCPPQPPAPPVCPTDYGYANGQAGVNGQVAYTNGGRF